MSHIGGTKEMKLPGNRSDLASEWKETRLCCMGCHSFKVININSAKKATDKSISSFLEKTSRSSKNSRDYPSSNSANLYDMGIDHYEIWTDKKKIIDHKKMTVSERKIKKSKPSSVPAGSKLVEIHRYVVDYDYREFDPLEHGGESLSEFVRGNYLFMHDGNLPKPVIYIEPASRQKKAEPERER